jgi:hypothetical protein
VNTNGTSIPWSSLDVELASGTVQPTAWALKDGVPYPYEHAFRPTGFHVDNIPALPTEFLAKFYQALKDAELDDILGLGIYPKEKYTIEATVGRANVTWAGKGHSFAGVTPTMWAIGDPHSGTEPVMACTQVCGYQTRNRTTHVATRHDQSEA